MSALKSRPISSSWLSNIQTAFLTGVEAKVSWLLFDGDVVERPWGPRLRVPRIHQLLFESPGAAGDRRLRVVSLVRRSAVAHRGLVSRARRFLRREEGQTRLRQLPLKPEGREVTRGGLRVPPPPPTICSVNHIEQDLTFVPRRRMSQGGRRGGAAEQTAGFGGSPGGCGGGRGSGWERGFGGSCWAAGGLKVASASAGAELRRDEGSRRVPARRVEAEL